MTEIKATTVQGTPQLVYTLTTVPDVVVVGATQVKIIINAALQDSDATVDIKAITIEFPLGDGQNQLCHDSSDISAPSLTDWSLTTIITPSGSVKYVYVPEGQTQIGPGGLTFAFTQVTVNDQPGSVEIDVTEASIEEIDIDFAIVPLYLVKFPSATGAISFQVGAADIPFNGATTLNWNGPEGATYAIQYTDYDSNQVVNVPLGNGPGIYPAAGQPPLKLTHTTIFTLNVQQTVNHQPCQWQLQQTVTVAAPEPQITSFSGSVDVTKSPRMINLSWTSTNTTYCMLKGDPRSLNPNVHKCAAAPAATYTLTGVLPLADGTPLLSGQSTLQLGYEVAGSYAGNNPGKTAICLALAPDNSSLYVADGGAVWIVAPTTDDNLPLQLTNRGITGGNGWGCPWLVVSPDGSLVYVSFTLPGSSTSIQAYSSSSLMPQGSAFSLEIAWPVNGMAVCRGNSNTSYLFVSIVDPDYVPLLYVFSITEDNSNPLQAFGQPTKSPCSPLAMASSPDGTQLVMLAADGGGSPSLMVYSPSDNPDAPLNHVNTYPAPGSGAIGLAIAPGQSFPAAVFDASGQVTPFDFDTMAIGATSPSINGLVNIAVAPDGSRIYAIDATETIWALVPGALVADQGG